MNFFFFLIIIHLLCYIVFGDRQFICFKFFWLIFLSFHFSRTPGSRQPSPAEEHLARATFGLDQGINVNVGGFQPMMQHMLNNHDQQQMGSSSFHPQHPLGPHVLNGGMPVQVRKCDNKKFIHAWQRRVL